MRARRRRRGGPGICFGTESDHNEIDFGAWEGPVYSFIPDVPGGTVINPAAYNMANPAAM
jgi:hypothetical protein